jgi:23S rRNA U2552 (ribose-2'-O)-methylase RlmE/FtsJ
MKPLTKIGLKHQTDKAYFHLFTEFYNDYFEQFLGRPIQILEIGIAGGNSLTMLQEFFPEATIHAIDINETSVRLDLGKRIHKYLCSQDDFPQLTNIFQGMKFDIIIEDGSHLTSHQQTSLGFFFPYLQKNGIYICEDLHTSYHANYIDTEITALEFIQCYQKYKTFPKTSILSPIQIQYLEQNIAKLEIYEKTQNAYQCWNCKSQNPERKPACTQCQTILSPSDKSITSVITHTA